MCDLGAGGMDGRQMDAQPDHSTTCLDLSLRSRPFSLPH